MAAAVKMGNIVDGARVGAMYVLVNGFPRYYNAATILKECTGLSLRNDLGVDLADLGRRLAGDKPFRMFTNWNATSFAIAVRLKTGVIFSCAPYAKTTARELAYVLWREGEEHTDDTGAKHTAQYLMTALPEGSRYTNSKSLAEPAVVAMIRAVITSEAELGLFRFMVQKMLADSNIDKALYQWSPMAPAT